MPTRRRRGDMPHKPAPQRRTNRDFFEGEHLNNRGETEATAYKKRQSANKLGALLAEAGYKLEHVAHDTPMSQLKLELRRRTSMTWALRFDIPFSVDEKGYKIEGRIFQALPEILDARGLTTGAIIHKNHGGSPEVPHEIIKGLDDGSEDVWLRDLEGDFGEYRYLALNLALHATIIEPAPQPE